ncbi:GNAT family N-acetyltransferase [Deinococcus fonticola]|uniref:GNAT family N-acetyltransferase n=1 Tax=Deinococcus fonticola TaxID=2528713 RepID=UPI001F11763A|nr:GNAT family N-acetyltransferase [Deinococcus fonticola]
MAFASGGPARQYPGYEAELYTLYSLKEVQGHGIGKALLHALARELQTGGAKNMALWVLDVNPTRHWYARQGASAAGEKQEGALRELRMVWDDLSRLLVR